MNSHKLIIDQIDSGNIFSMKASFPTFDYRTCLYDDSSYNAILYISVKFDTFPIDDGIHLLLLSGSSHFFLKL